MKGALHPYINLAPEFLRPSINIWLEGEGRNVFLSETVWWLLWCFICHSKGSQRCSLSLIVRIWTLLDTGRRSCGLDGFLEGSFILSCVLGTLVQEKIWIWYLSCKLSFFIKLSVVDTSQGQGWNVGEDQGVESVVEQVRENWRWALGQAWIKGSRFQS